MTPLSKGFSSRVKRKNDCELAYKLVVLYRSQFYIVTNVT